ncbi:MAG: hypothetical protein IJS10_00815 [Alphaproteobacteria bacterium]|nr:hypothetical protein [Alphaproteobacteria bacterium]
MFNLREFFLATAVRVFQDSLREHYDNVRKKAKTDLLKTGKGCNYKYYLSVYSVIPTELAKIAYNIKIKFGSVYYAKDAGDIIECVSTRNVFFECQLVWLM